MTDTVTTLDPCRVRRVERFDKAAYEIVRNTILKNLLAYGAMPCEQLGAVVEKHLQHKLYGSLQRYYEIVRRELEVRGEIRVDRKVEPPLIMLAV